jgi:hypothetical protein
MASSSLLRDYHSININDHTTLQATLCQSVFGKELNQYIAWKAN